MLQLQFLSFEGNLQANVGVSNEGDPNIKVVGIDQIGVIRSNENNAPTIAVVDDVSPHEGISDVGRKRSSQGSSKSGGSSTASARLRAQADKAALKARSSALKERRALEEQQLRRKREAAWLGSRSGCSHC